MPEPKAPMNQGTLSREEIAKVLEEVRTSLRAQMREDLYSFRAITASADIYMVEHIARKLGVALEPRTGEAEKR